MGEWRGCEGAGFGFGFQSSSHGVSPRSYAPQRDEVTMMPIGVPKVKYKMPHSQHTDWVDIYNRLYRERIIFLAQELDTALANQIIGVLLYLDSESKTKPIYLYINSPGGSVSAGLALYDTMKHVSAPIVTINVGLAASMASVILAAGSKRMALPHSRTMIHQPMGGARGQASDIKVEAAHILSIKKNMVDMYAKATNQPSARIEMDMSRDNYMSAQEALDYGLIDEIIQTDGVHAQGMGLDDNVRMGL
jgi:ATP-dependent Clp protease protease subunit